MDNLNVYEENGVNEFRKVTEYMISVQKSVVILYTNKNQILEVFGKKA